MEDNKPTARYKDGGCSFVVEVQPDYDREEMEGNKGSSDDMTAGITDQQALVHREEIPDDRSSGKRFCAMRTCAVATKSIFHVVVSGFENTRLFGSTNTGLSQSDLSISSQGSANPSYRYGNQVEYDSGHLGYPMYGGSYESDVLSRKLEGRSKWVEFDKSPDIEKTLLDDSRDFTNEEDEAKNVSGKRGRMEGRTSCFELFVENREKVTKFLLSYLSRDRNRVVIIMNKYITDHSRTLVIETLLVRFQPHFFGKSKNVSSLQDVVSAVIREDSLEINNFPDTVRSNPNLQVNGTTPNKLEIMEQKALSNDFAGKSESNNKPVITCALLKDDVQEDAFQEQQRKLGNGTLTPEHKQDRTMDHKPEGSVFVPSHKRTGSIPPRLIEETLEMDRKKSLDIYNKYSQIKTSTRSILPSLSPKFELLQNEVSPIEEKES